jgi:hypothetical protein
MTKLKTNCAGTGAAAVLPAGTEREVLSDGICTDLTEILYQAHFFEPRLTDILLPRKTLVY